MFQEGGIIFFYLAGTLFIILLVAFILFFVYIHHLRMQQFQSELAKQELKKQQELYFALQEGEEKERKRLAEELHDGIGARLSGLKMNLEYLQSKYNNVNYDAMFVKLVHEMDESINEIRELSQNLKPAFISAQHLRQALYYLVDKLNTASPIATHIEVRIDHDPPIEMKLAVYRMVTELLNNIYKHSKASEAFIQVMEEGGNLQILIEDNGVGFDPAVPKTGNGMYNVKSRAIALKGDFFIDSSPKGTTVIIDIPLIQP
jgi:two-component system, NarL family, sensor kinase